MQEFQLKRGGSKSGAGLLKSYRQKLYSYGLYSYGLYSCGPHVGIVQPKELLRRRAMQRRLHVFGNSVPFLIQLL